MNLRPNTGVHTDNEDKEGKGRGVKRPCEALKFQTFPMVVVLLI